MTDDKGGSMAENTTLVQEIRCAINRLSMERESNTPDYILAQYLGTCLGAINTAIKQRELHCGRYSRQSIGKTDDKGAGVKEQMYSDVMTDTQASRFGGYSDGYNAGRKAERERCAKIAEGYFNARGRVVAKAIMGDMMQSEIDKRPYVHECGKTNYIFCPACVYAEGRKAAEKDFDRFFRLEEGAGD